ncbi:MAG TPA: histidine kinase [Telluria sp.]|nr:histidine kinase [Telluria sp.]
MTGPFSSRRGAALYLSVWLVLGLVLSALVVGATGAAWSNAGGFAVPLTLVYGLAAGFSAYYLCRAFPLADVPPLRIVGVFSVSAVIAGGLWTSAGMAWNEILASGGMGVTISQPTRALVFGIGVALYVLCAMANYLVTEFERTRNAERRELQSKLMAQDAELRMLRTQIDPHFLFNSLNSISALTSIDPARAREMTLQLSDFFRHSLGLEAHRKVTLADEATLVNHFLAIEKVRFGQRLGVVLEIADEARPCLLPPMILQPLVENAVKHGIGALPEGGTVSVHAARTGSMLRVTVENDVDADAPPINGKGIGLANVRKRLAAAYEHHASVHWSQQNNKFRVELALPAETEGD